MKQGISKYFWSLNDRALEETVRILKNPRHPRFREKVIAVMSLCDEPAQMFKAVPKEIFIAHWPSIRREWKRTQHSLDFLYWWDAIYQNLIKNQGTVLSGEGSRQLRFIGKQIRSARLKKEWSQDDVAARIKVDQRKISAVESGQSNITMETLLKIARAVGLNKINFDFSN